MIDREIDEVAINRLAWLIAEEFVKTGNMLGSLNHSDGLSRARDRHEIQLLFAWGDPFVPLTLSMRL